MLPLLRPVAILLLLGATLQAEERRPEVLHRIAFGSCASQEKPQPIWDAVNAQHPELFLFIGDTIYANTEDMAVMRAKYAKLAALPGYQQLLATCPVLATWDDHDYGVNDGGEWYPKKVESQKMMLDFFNVPANSPRRQRAGVYGEYTFGPAGRRVQIILLDTRYFKSRHCKDTRTEEEKKQLNIVGWYVPNDDPATTILGAEQWRWLEAQLREPAEIRIIVSSIQVIADAKGMESWGNFPHERQRLYNLIARAGAKGVFLISGDVHFSEISRTDEGPYPLYEFTSSSLTHCRPDWTVTINPQRVSEIAYAQPTFGMIEIDWEKPTPEISLSARGLQGEVAFQKILRLADLTPK